MDEEGGEMRKEEATVMGPGEAVNVAKPTPAAVQP